MHKKTPIWEIEEFTPENRKYEYSSYAVDKSLEKSKADKVGTLDTSKIKKNRIYSYKELCELLDEKVQTSSEGKYNQQRKWECFFEFIPIKRKGFQIGRIYKEPRYERYVTAKEIKEITNANYQYIYQVLLMLLYDPNSSNENDFYEFRANKWQMYRLLGFANELFFKNYIWPGEYIDRNNYTPKRMNMIEKKFYNDALQYFSKLLQRSLEQLHVCKKINYYWETTVVDVKTGAMRRASREEAVLITKIEGEVLDALDAENIYEIANNEDKLDSFRQRVIERCGAQLGIRNYWDEIDIWVVKTNVKTGIMRMYQRFRGGGSDISAMKRQYQEEGALMMNQLIINYFYELNTKSACKYGEYLFEKYGEDMSDSDITMSYTVIKGKRDEMVKKYIEIKDYFNGLQKRILTKPHEVPKLK